MLMAAAASISVSVPLAARIEPTSSTPESLYGGLPISNFAIAAQVPADGSLFGHIWRDTGKLGDWLIDSGKLSVTVHSGGKDWSLAEFRHKSIDRDAPVICNSYRDKSKVGAGLRMEAFCPIVAQNADETALPCILLQIDAEAFAAGQFSIRIAPEDKAVKLFSDEKGASIDADGVMEIPFDLGKGESRRVRVAIATHDPRWTTSARFEDASATAAYAFGVWDWLRASTVSFAKMMPVSGDRVIDRNLQYYMLPALILTRMTAKGQVLTMGYVELNQRDSFWTTWMHLMLFKDIEWQMIEESYAYMRDSGKIPTCILPRLDRKDDLDINLFLILRTARYYAVHHNGDALKALWPKVKQVMDWVVGRDFDGAGLPQQVSEWCDWKDVRFMLDRKYSAFVSLLYLASLDQMRKMAVICGDADAERRYSSIYDKAYDKVNRPVEEGGLWNGRYYVQVMKDGSVQPQLHQDQMIGVMYGVVPEERAESIMDCLNEMSVSPYGVCNMYPYLEGVEYPGGVYHNGGMWPWLSFMDCWGRVEAGRRKEAVKLVKTVFKADLFEGDYVPNENVNTANGDNIGPAIQGWNADLFGLVWFGFQHPESPWRL